MTFDPNKLRRIVEGALLAAGKPLTVLQLEALFDEDDARPARDEIKAALEDVANEIQGRGFELVQVASGYRLQVCDDLAPWVSRLWEEKPQKYSRALLETLALIAYRQPITRGEIEEIRGVAVSSNIIRTLMERDWVRVVGHREVPGRPAMYATTKTFLDYFNLRSLDQLPPLTEIQDLDNLTAELGLEVALEQTEQQGDSGQHSHEETVEENGEEELKRLEDESEHQAELAANDEAESISEEDNDETEESSDDNVVVLPTANSADKE